MSEQTTKDIRPQTATDTSAAITLGTERLSKLLPKYSIPAIIAMIASSLYNVVDSIFIGQAVNALALSGLGITMPLMNLSAAFGSLVGLGGSALMSIKLGQNDKRGAGAILGNVLLLNIVISLGYTLALLPFLDRVLYLLAATPDTIGYARQYMFIILCGNIFTHIYLGLNDLLRSSGYPSKAMRIMLTAIGLNILLDALFILVFQWGIAGAAWATVLAQITAMILELKHFSNSNHQIHFKKALIRFNRSIIKGILAIGMAPFLMYACSSLIIILINRSLGAHGGDLYIGAYTTLNRIVMLFIMVVMGLNQGMQPIVGYNYGARKFDRVRKTLKYVIVIAVGVTTTGFLIGQFFPYYIIRLFTPDTELIAITEHAIRIVLIMFPVVGFQMVASNFFQSIGKPGKAIFLSLTRQMLFLVPLLLILPRYYGSDGVWMSLPIADAAAIILAAILLYRQMRLFRNMPQAL